MRKRRWVDGEQITRELGYIHPNRAITDVRHSGYEVDDRWARDEQGRRYREWRLASRAPTREARARQVLPTADAGAVMARDDYTCALCRRRLPAEKLRVDHKVPVDRGGDKFDRDQQDWADHLQTLCLWCNYEKREICKKCDRSTCDGCELADPRAYSGLMLRLPRGIAAALERRAAEAGVTIADFLTRELVKAAASKRGEASGQ